MSQSLISVIVPVYNVKEYLNTCVESIRGARTVRHAVDGFAGLYRRLRQGA